MTSPLAPQIKAVPGSPASVRVGTVLSVSPLQVSVQGTVFRSDAVGFAGSYAPQVGDSVVLLGQSSAAGPDPSSWVALASSTSSGLQPLFASGTVSTTLVVADTTIPGTTIPFTTTAAQTMVQAWWTGDFDAVGAVISTSVLRPILDGVVQGQVQAIWEMSVAAAVGRSTSGNQTIYMVGPGAHTIGLSGAANNAGNIRVVAGSTTLMVNVYG